MKKGTGYILFVLLIFSSCVKIPVSQYKQLNSSTQDLNNKIIETYSRLEKIQRQYFVTRVPNKPLDANSFAPVVKGINFDLTPSLNKRAAAVNLISKYFNVLYVFSSKDYMKDIDQASTDLAASVKTININTIKVKSGEASIIGNAFGILVDASSKQLIDAKKIKVLKQSMDSTREQIDILTKLLIHDDSLYIMALDQWRDALIRHANMNRPLYATISRYEFDLQFANLLDEIVDIKQSLIISNNAVSKIPKVFSDIRNLLDKKDVKMDALQDLISEGQRLSTVYNNLNK